MASTNPHSHLHRQALLGKPKQQGVALIVAILIVAVVTVAAVSMHSRSERDKRLTQNILRSDQALRYGMGAEAFVSKVLREDLVQNKYDHFGEPWLQAVTLPIEEGILQGQLFDRQGCFNINNLSNDPDNHWLLVLQQLFINLKINASLAQAIVDWVDTDQDARIPDGAEDSAYYNQTPAYRTADGPIGSVSELQLINGIDKTTYQVLKTQLCALPASNTAININTASLELLNALNRNHSISSDLSGLHAKITAGEAYTDKGDFDTAPETAGMQFDVPLTVQSSWFLSQASATIGETSVSQTSLIHRDSSGVKVVGRSRLEY